MTGSVAEIWRYPVKSHGAEALTETTLRIGETLPGDRVWAVLHEAAEAADPTWMSCRNFTRVAKAPALAAMRAELLADGGTVRLSHPERPDLTFRPDTESAVFLDWVTPLMPADRAQPVALLRRANRGFTDSPEPTVSLCNFASHRAVSQKLGLPLSHLRWRGNIWLNDLGPWQEFEWPGRRLALGDAELEVIGRIDRCSATTANPDTGRRDADTLGALEDGWNHRDFGVVAVVTRAGTVAQGASVKVLA